MIDDDEICSRCGGAIGMVVERELQCRCRPAELLHDPYRAAAPSPALVTPRNLTELFALYGAGNTLPPIGPVTDPEDL